MSALPSTRPWAAGEARVERCPICGSEELTTFLELSDMPVQDGVVYATREAAVDAPIGDVRLAVCRCCHYVGNLAFDADKVRFAEYSYSQHHSPQYRRHVDEVVAHLVEMYALRNKTVIDIGCGDGFFLNRICRAGNNRGVGIDPSLRAERPIDDDRLMLIQAFYSDKYASHRGELVSCRHVIDELADPRGFLELIRGALSADPGAILYLELPDATRTFERKLVWNVGYAKRSWFTAESLGALLRICGLEAEQTKTLFGGDYLGIVGRRAPDSKMRPLVPEESAERLMELLDGFDRHFKREVGRWERRIARLRERNEQMVVWGAGMRGINFLGRFGDPAVFPRIVDVNPDRQGSYLPGSGYLVDRPDILKQFPPQRVLVSNPSYEDEIRRQLLEIGVACDVESL